MTRAQRLGHTGTRTRWVVVQILLGSALVGAGLGVAWWLLAPDVTGVVIDGAVRVDAREGQQLFGRDAVFALLAGACGLITAVGFFVWHRHRPVTVLVCLAVFGVGGSWLAEFVGSALGPDADVSGLADGAERAVALQMDSQAGLFVWSMVATVVVAVVAVFREDHAHWAVPGAPPPP